MPLAEAWDGSEWKVQSTAVPAGASFAEADAVGCWDGRCEAVGVYVSASGVDLPTALTKG